MFHTLSLEYQKNLGIKYIHSQMIFHESAFKLYCYQQTCTMYISYIVLMISKYELLAKYIRLKKYNEMLY